MLWSVLKVPQQLLLFKCVHFGTCCPLNVCFCPNLLIQYVKEQKMCLEFDTSFFKHTNMLPVCLNRQPTTGFDYDQASIYQTEDIFQFQIYCWAFDSRADSMCELPVSFTFIQRQVCLCWYYSKWSAISDGWWKVEKASQWQSCMWWQRVWINYGF